MGKAKLFGTIGKMTVGALAPDLLEQGTKVVSDQLEKRKNYVKIPDVKLLNVDEATATMKQYGFNHSLVKVVADIKYANRVPNSVVKIQPRGNTSVDPKTFVKVYYIDEETVAQSQKLAKDLEINKLNRKHKTQEQIHNAIDATSKVSSHVTEKLHFKKTTKDSNESHE
ncbi:PASTA domain-containing protein [Leuconostoc rapi]|uniref:PASTA domain-containing protein n=1 Tax=Leuconostoc rapi TaxID=1406906 RepID=UPI00195E4241|nr:PASTA domain-containing protein [Leuconostoc rapi]MBM7436467.1 hypothetical protein [Leuconostoc rapi]